MILSLLRSIHKRFIYPRRIATLADGLSNYIPSGSVLDVGAGTGALAEALLAKRTDITLQALDIKSVTGSRIVVREFNGVDIPSEDSSFDIVLLIDVLHHCTDQWRIIDECARVARKGIIIKDHVCNTRLDKAILTIMDFVGNAPYGNPLPYNFLTMNDWTCLFRRYPYSHVSQFYIMRYPFPVNLIMHKRLQSVFILDLNKEGRSSGN